MSQDNRPKSYDELHIYPEDVSSSESCSCKPCSGLANNNHFDHIDHDQLMEEMAQLPIAVRDFLLEAVRLIHLLGDHNADPESHPDMRKYIVDGMESINRALEVHNASEAAHPGIFRIISELQDIISDAGGLARPTILEEIGKHNEDVMAHPAILKLIADYEASATANPVAFAAHNEDANAHTALMEAHNESKDVHPELLRDHNLDPDAHTTLLLNHSVDTESHKEQWDAHNKSEDVHSGLMGKHNIDPEAHSDLRELMDSADARLQESITELDSLRISKIGIIEFGSIPNNTIITTLYDINGGGKLCPHATISESEGNWIFTCTAVAELTLNAFGPTEEECNNNAVIDVCAAMCPLSTTEYVPSTSYILPDGREFHINRYQDFSSKINSQSIVILHEYDPDKPMAWSWAIPGVKVKAPNIENEKVIFRGTISPETNGAEFNLKVPTATSTEYGLVKLGIPDGETIFDGPRPEGMSVGRVIDMSCCIYMGVYADKIYDLDGNEIDDDGNIITPAIISDVTDIPVL